MFSFRNNDSNFPQTIDLEFRQIIRTIYRDRLFYATLLSSFPIVVFIFSWLLGDWAFNFPVTIRTLGLCLLFGLGYWQLRKIWLPAWNQRITPLEIAKEFDRKNPSLEEQLSLLVDLKNQLSISPIHSDFYIQILQEVQSKAHRLKHPVAVPGKMRFSIWIAWLLLLLMIYPLLGLQNFSLGFKRFFLPWSENQSTLFYEIIVPSGNIQYAKGEIVTISAYLEFSSKKPEKQLVGELLLKDNQGNLSHLPLKYDGNEIYSITLKDNQDLEKNNLYAIQIGNQISNWYKIQVRQSFQLVHAKIESKLPAYWRNQKGNIIEGLIPMKVRQYSEIHLQLEFDHLPKRAILQWMNDNEAGADSDGGKIENHKMQLEQRRYIATWEVERKGKFRILLEDDSGNAELFPNEWIVIDVEEDQPPKIINPIGFYIEPVIKSIKDRWPIRFQIQEDHQISEIIFEYQIGDGPSQKLKMDLQNIAKQEDIFDFEYVPDWEKLLKPGQQVKYRFIVMDDRILKRGDRTVQIAYYPDQNRWSTVRFRDNLKTSIDQSSSESKPRNWVPREFIVLLQKIEKECQHLQESVDKPVQDARMGKFLTDNQRAELYSSIDQWRSLLHEWTLEIKQLKSNPDLLWFTRKMEKIHWEIHTEVIWSLSKAAETNNPEISSKYLQSALSSLLKRITELNDFKKLIAKKEKNREVGIHLTQLCDEVKKVMEGQATLEPLPLTKSPDFIKHFSKLSSELILQEPFRDIIKTYQDSFLIDMIAKIQKIGQFENELAELCADRYQAILTEKLANTNEKAKLLKKKAAIVKSARDRWLIGNEVSPWSTENAEGILRNLMQNDILESFKSGEKNVAVLEKQIAQVQQFVDDLSSPKIFLARLQFALRKWFEIVNNLNEKPNNLRDLLAPLQEIKMGLLHLNFPTQSILDINRNKLIQFISDLSNDLEKNSLEDIARHSSNLFALFRSIDQQLNPKDFRCQLANEILQKQIQDLNGIYQNQLLAFLLSVAHGQQTKKIEDKQKLWRDYSAAMKSFRKNFFAIDFPCRYVEILRVDTLLVQLDRIIEQQNKFLFLNRLNQLISQLEHLTFSLNNDLQNKSIQKILQSEDELLNQQYAILQNLIQIDWQDKKQLNTLLGKERRIYSLWFSLKRNITVFDDRFVIEHQNGIHMLETQASKEKLEKKFLKILKRLIFAIDADRKGIFADEWLKELDDRREELVVQLKKSPKKNLSPEVIFSVRQKIQGIMNLFMQIPFEIPFSSTTTNIGFKLDESYPEKDCYLILRLLKDALLQTDLDVLLLELTAIKIPLDRLIVQQKLARNYRKWNLSELIHQQHLFLYESYRSFFYKTKTSLPLVADSLLNMQSLWCCHLDKKWLDKSDFWKLLLSAKDSVTFLEFIKHQQKILSYLQNEFLIESLAVWKFDIFPQREDVIQLKEMLAIQSEIQIELKKIVNSPPKDHTYLIKIDPLASLLNRYEHPRPVIKFTELSRLPENRLPNSQVPHRVKQWFTLVEPYLKVGSIQKAKNLIQQLTDQIDQVKLDLLSAETQNELLQIKKQMIALKTVLESMNDQAGVIRYQQFQKELQAQFQNLKEQWDIYFEQISILQIQIDDDANKESELIFREMSKFPWQEINELFFQFLRPKEMDNLKSLLSTHLKLIAKFDHLPKIKSADLLQPKLLDGIASIQLDISKTIVSNYLKLLQLQKQLLKKSNHSPQEIHSILMEMIKLCKSINQEWQHQNFELKHNDSENKTDKLSSVQTGKKLISKSPWASFLVYFFSEIVKHFKKNMNSPPNSYFYGREYMDDIQNYQINRNKND